MGKEKGQELKGNEGGKGWKGEERGGKVSLKHDGTDVSVGMVQIRATTLRQTGNSTMGETSDHM